MTMRIFLDTIETNAEQALKQYGLHHNERRALENIVQAVDYIRELPQNKRAS